MFLDILINCPHTLTTTEDRHQFYIYHPFQIKLACKDSQEKSKFCMTLGQENFITPNIFLALVAHWIKKKPPPPSSPTPSRPSPHPSQQIAMCPPWVTPFNCLLQVTLAGRLSTPHTTPSQCPHPFLTVALPRAHHSVKTQHPTETALRPPPGEMWLSARSLLPFLPCYTNRFVPI